jgi:hypothetical protein
MGSILVFTRNGTIAAVAVSVLVATAVGFMMKPGFEGNAADVPFSVNRALKGDRLPQARPVRDTHHRSPFIFVPSAAGPRLVGCDPVFSPVTDPARARLYGRCLT